MNLNVYHNEVNPFFQNSVFVSHLVSFNNMGKTLPIFLQACS